jgi:hypothetical protein
MVFSFFDPAQINVYIICVHIKIPPFQLLVIKQAYTAAMNQLHTAAFIAHTGKHTALILNWKR